MTIGYVRHHHFMTPLSQSYRQLSSRAAKVKDSVASVAQLEKDHKALGAIGVRENGYGAGDEGT
jgi:hypothetical protein